MQKLRLMSHTESFGDFIRRIRNEKGLSCKEVEKQSARFGKPISGSYINRIENQPTLRPTADRLMALANGLGIPVEELLARAVGVAPSNDSSHEFQLLTRFKKLSAERRADVLKIVDMWYSEQIKST